MKAIYLENWFAKKITNEEHEAITQNKIIKETEKAILFEGEVKRYCHINEEEVEQTLNVWVPKSAIKNEESQKLETVETARNQMINVLKNNKIKGATLRTKNSKLVQLIIENNLIQEINGFDLIDNTYFKLNENFEVNEIFTI